MKEEVIPEVRQGGVLDQVVFTQVDADAKPALCRRLLRGNSIPQLVLYSRVGKFWRRTQLTGVHAPDKIRSFLQREIAAGQAEAKQAGQPSEISVSRHAVTHGATTAQR